MVQEHIQEHMIHNLQLEIGYYFNVCFSESVSELMLTTTTTMRTCSQEQADVFFSVCSVLVLQAEEQKKAALDGCKNPIGNGAKGRAELSPRESQGTSGALEV